MPITTLYTREKARQIGYRLIRKICITIASPESLMANQQKRRQPPRLQSEQGGCPICMQGYETPYPQRTGIDEIGRSYNLRLRGVLLCERFSKRGKAFSLCSMRLQEPSALKTTDITSKRTGRSMAYIRT